MFGRSGCFERLVVMQHVDPDSDGGGGGEGLTPADADSGGARSNADRTNVVLRVNRVQ